MLNCSHVVNGYEIIKPFLRVDLMCCVSWIKLNESVPEFFVPDACISFSNCVDHWSWITPRHNLQRAIICMLKRNAEMFPWLRILAEREDRIDSITYYHKLKIEIEVCPFSVNDCCNLYRFFVERSFIYVPKRHLSVLLYLFIHWYSRR